MIDDPNVEVENVEIRDAQQDGIPMEVRYNRAWLTRSAEHLGYQVSANNAMVDRILDQLSSRNGQCPSVDIDHINFRCPCLRMREHGICRCGLFEYNAPRRIIGSTSVTAIKRG